MSESARGGEIGAYDCPKLLKPGSASLNDGFGWCYMRPNAGSHAR